VRKALLDKKLDKKQKHIENLCKVPTAAQWTTQIHEKSLTPTHLYKIIKTTVAPLAKLADVPCSVEMPHILKMAAGAFSLAETLKSKHASKHAIAVAKLVGFVLLRVSEGVEGVRGHSFGTYSKSWQIRCRNLASWVCWMMAELEEWKGREMQLYLMLGKN
jgi:hypothetical protein